MRNRHANLMRASGINDEDIDNERTEVIDRSAEANGTKHPLETYLGKFSRYKVNIDNFNDVCKAIYESLKSIGRKNQFEEGMNTILGKNGQNLIALIRKNAPRNCYNITAIELDLRTQVGSILLPSRPKRDEKELLLAWTTKRDNIQREISDLLLPLIPEKERGKDVDCEGKTGIPEDPNEFTRQAIEAVQTESLEEVVVTVDLEKHPPENDQAPVEGNGDIVRFTPTMPSAKGEPAPKLLRASDSVTVTESGTGRRTNAIFNSKRLAVPLLAGAALLGGVTAVSILTTKAQRDHFYARIEEVLRLK